MGMSGLHLAQSVYAHVAVDPTPAPMMPTSLTSCTAPASSFAEQSAEDVVPFRPAKAPDTPLQETAPQALEVYIR